LQLAFWNEGSNVKLFHCLHPNSIALSLLCALIPAQLMADDEAAAKDSELKRATAVAQPLYSRHIVPVFSRLGCNAGACHGAVKGQGGFRLSLFGADPTLDHQRILRDDSGRRLDLIDPDASLILQKAFGAVPHEGGQRAAKDSPEYQMIRSWIAAGAKLDRSADSQIKELRIVPAKQRLEPGKSISLRVQATFADGSTDDVTSLCTFAVADKNVATIDATGKVHAVAVGDTTAVVRYRAEPAIVQLLVPRLDNVPFPEVPTYNFIDRHIHAKLRQLNIHPSDPCDDATFLRRLSLDVAGDLPTPGEVRKFLADKDPAKRTKKVDELLARPGHASVWAAKFCDILKPTGFNLNYFTEYLEARRFHGWIRDRLSEGIRYDDLVERILTATSREGRSADAYVTEMRVLIEEEIDASRELKAYSNRRTLDLYWQKERGNADGGTAPVKSAVQVAHAFLGLRLECAQCHRHPHDVWQQDDLLSFASFFTKIAQAGGNSKAQPDVAALFDAKAAAEQQKKKREQAKLLSDRIMKEKGLSKEEAEKLRKEALALESEARNLSAMIKRINTEIHTAVTATVAEARSPLGQQKASQYRLLGQTQPVRVPDGQDARVSVMAWMRQPNNPFFATAIVNRVWAHYFDRGLVDPVDQLSPLNPPSHPELLQELGNGFVKSGFDLKWLHHTILTSRTYQLSCVPNETNRADNRNYARFYLRRLPAELVLDAINHATGASESFPAELRMPAGAKALDLAGGVPNERNNPKASALIYALQLFGRPIRNASIQCDCERENNASMVQTIYLINHPEVREKITNPQGRIAGIVKNNADVARLVEEAFLWVLGRMPTSEEREKSIEYLKDSASAQKGVEGLFRTLMLADEFILNH